VSARARSDDAEGRAAKVWRQRGHRALPPGGSSGSRCRRSHSGQATVSITHPSARQLRWPRPAIAPGSYPIRPTSLRIARTVRSHTRSAPSNRTLDLPGGPPKRPC